VLHWFCSEGWPDSEHITPHFHVLLIVPAKYFEARSRLCIGQAEWRVMWEERACVPTADGSPTFESPKIRMRLRNSPTPI
jgi:Replication protein